MRNQGNRVVVWYPGFGLRVRSCQTTVYPEGYLKRGLLTPEQHTIAFNEWATYIRSSVDPNLAAGEILLAEAKGLLVKQIILKP